MTSADDKITAINLKNRLISLEEQLNRFVVYEQSFIEGLPKSFLPDDLSKAPVPGAITKVLNHLLKKEIEKSLYYQNAFRFWMVFGSIEFLLIFLLIALYFLK